MSIPSEVLTLLSLVANLRAAGTSFPDTAKKISVDERELHRLTIEHQRDYDRLARRARADALREASAVALAALSKLAQSEDPKVSGPAAANLARFVTAHMRHDQKLVAQRLQRERQRARTTPATALDRMPPREVIESNTSAATNITSDQRVAGVQKSATPASVKPIDPDKLARQMEQFLFAGRRNGAKESRNVTANASSADPRTATRREEVAPMG